MALKDLLNLPDLDQAISCDTPCLLIENPNNPNERKIGFFDLGAGSPLHNWKLIARLPATAPG